MKPPAIQVVRNDDESAAIILNHPDTGDMMVTLRLSHDQKIWLIGKLLGTGKLVATFDDNVLETTYEGGDLHEQLSDQPAAPTATD